MPDNTIQATFYASTSLLDNSYVISSPLSNFSNILNQHNIVAVFNNKGLITYANKNFCDLYQLSPEELAGKTYLSLQIGYQTPSFFVQMWQDLNAGKIWKGEIKTRVKDNTHRWIDTVITPSFNEAGAPAEYVAIHTDTTRYRQAEQRINELLTDAQEMNEELKASEEELRQTLEHAVAVNEKISLSEARYRLISETMRDMICLHKLDGTYTYISQSVKTLLGYEPEELIATNPFLLFHPDDVEYIKNQAHYTSLSGSPDNYVQYRIRKKDGTYTWFETITHPIADDYGKVTSLHTASRDISSRKMAEDQRDNFFNHSLELMVVADLEGKVIKVNNSWEKTFQYTNEELKEISLLDFIHPDDIESTIQAKDKEQQRGTPTIAFENRYRCKDGSYRWLSWNSVSFSKENLMYGFARDITEWKYREEMLKNTLDELKIRNHELDNYVYKVSHDLRAPLTSIMGLINLIKIEQNSDTIRQYVNLIENRIIKSDQFILSIINHSKILNSEPEVNLIDFQQIITECFEDLKFIPNTARIRHEVTFSQQAPFYNDLFRINIIFKNFISNAIKYLNPYEKDNYVKFTITAGQQHVKIDIQDNGIGIEPEIISRLFEMFFRGTPVSDGSGLGLYIVKQTIEQLHGKIEVESKAGKGTLFSVTLPNKSGYILNQ